MSKKNKKNLKALIAKRRELQKLQQSSTISIPGTPLQSRPSAPQLESNTEKTVPALPVFHPGQEIWRTVISTLAIAFLLVAITVANSRTGFLKEFGNTLYQTLQLDN